MKIDQEANRRKKKITAVRAVENTHFISTASDIIHYITYAFRITPFQLGRFKVVHG